MPTRVMNNGENIEAGVFLMKQKGVVFNDVESNEENGLVKNSKIIQNITNFSNESSSSIGKNSDLSDNLMEKSCDDDDEEVQSSYNKGALDAMDALEQVLPIRRGISSFYNGKSKSFTILSDASSYSSSIKAIAKPDNAYTRKRRNQLSCSLHWDNTRTSCLKTSNGISKRPTGSTRKTTLALGLAMANPECLKNYVDSKPSEFSPWRSFSLADLQQHCVSVAKTCSNSTMNLDS